jgi:hypothetical protein
MADPGGAAADRVLQRLEGRLRDLASDPVGDRPPVGLNLAPGAGALGTCAVVRPDAYCSPRHVL